MLHDGKNYCFHELICTCRKLCCIVYDKNPPQYVGMKFRYKVIFKSQSCVSNPPHYVDKNHHHELIFECHTCFSNPPQYVRKNNYFELMYEC